MIGLFISKKKISKGFESMNKHDLVRFLSDWSDNGTFIYPGDIHVSGRFEGIASVEKWFKNFFEQCPEIRFTINNFFFKNIFDFTGTNTIAVHWDVDLKNRKGKTIHNKGISVLSIKFGKVITVEDYIFNTGDEFREIWSAK
mgnify:CR=1 FL=1